MHDRRISWEVQQARKDEKIDKLEARVEELEAKTMALNHPDLEPGLLVHLVVEGSVPLHCGDDLANWGAGRIVGWLPWPGQTEGES